jgi:tetratricopeptide (TPR) repeat protein
MENQYDNAINDYSEVIRLDPNDVYAYESRGHSYYRKSQYDIAISDYSEAIRLNPNYASSAYASRGECYRVEGQYDAAINDFSNSLKCDHYAYTWNEKYLVMSGNMDIKMHPYPKNTKCLVIRILDTVIKLDPNDAVAYGLRSFAYKQLGQKNQTIQDFKKALKINANLEWVRKELEECKKGNNKLFGFLKKSN